MSKTVPDLNALASALESYEVAIMDHLHLSRIIGEAIVREMPRALNQSTDVVAVSTKEDWAPPSSANAFVYPAHPDLEPISMGMAIAVPRGDRGKTWIRIILQFEHVKVGTLDVRYGGRQRITVSKKNMRDEVESVCNTLVADLADYLSNPSWKEEGRYIGGVSLL